jgi:hypothetical protein
MMYENNKKIQLKKIISPVATPFAVAFCLHKRLQLINISLQHNGFDFQDLILIDKIKKGK